MTGGLRFVPAVGLLLFLCGFAPEKSAPIAGPPTRPATAGSLPIIVTSAPLYDPLASLANPDGERFPKGAHLEILRDGKAEPLVPSFAASADAQVFFDGMRVLFAGKKTPADHWAIWEMTLADRKLQLVAQADTDLERPFYMPARRVVYARRMEHGFAIEMAAIAADLNVVPVALTHMQAPALPVGVMRDGRVLFEAGFPLGSTLANGAKPELYLVYADGSGVESYRCDHASIGSGRWGGQEMASGDVVFTHGKSLARFTSPLATEDPVHAPAAEYAGQIAGLPSGQWLASARKPGGRYALTQFRPGSDIATTLYADPKSEMVEPVLLESRAIPKRHPSGLHDWPTANLLALDVRIAREGNLKDAPPTVQLEQQDEQGRAIVMGTAPVEPDGSFFVKVRGDRPIRFTLLDPSGQTVRAEHGWFWIRAGEQRICVGCHAGPEHASENKVPQVLLRTITPLDLSGLADKPAAGAK